ncbi:MAG: glycosyltransferase [Candidatus Competibacteraceae bacterium]|nr:glycosyltransferase [Candidatus Competibacteraceae bacterium]
MIKPAPWKKCLQRRFKESGIAGGPKIVILTRLIPNAEGTSCNTAREKVHGSDDCWILRVPFHDHHGNLLNDWVSRFHLWPYLRDFADRAKPAVVTELLGKPDLIIGHYSDGNLVAHLMAKDLDTTHCAAVHALEKTKYLFSDLHWSGMEHQYHWSLHFTADLIAYNAADFIITSSFREIGGTSDEMGMFESYDCFSMPGLYRVISGLDPLLARYNIVPPGASEEYFFPFLESDRRHEGIRQRLDDLLFTAPPAANVLGELKNPALPPIFAMSRVDKVKNLGGLVELYGKSPTLRHTANLILLSSIVDPAESKDAEEIEQLHLIREKIDAYGLHGHIRWIAARLDKIETGEIYRVIAGHRGVFAQPALMETSAHVIEAMACGLPVVVTCFGGPAESWNPASQGRLRIPTTMNASPPRSKAPSRMKPPGKPDPAVACSVSRRPSTGPCMPNACSNWPTCMPTGNSWMS